MKLMKIFGMVFALHVALACVIVLIQGCRSTAPSRTSEPGPAAVAPAEPESTNWTNQPSTASMPSSTASSLGSPPPAYGEPLSSLSPAERERAAPTRPTNPNEYISTSMPTAIAPPPPEPADYVVRAGDSFWKIARAHGTNTAALQKLNPNVKASSLRPGMIVKVPGTSTNTANTAFGSVPAASAPAAPADQPATTTYVVRSGDSLSKIAARNGTTVAALRDANALRSDVIQIGQELKIPVRVTGSTTFGVGDAPATSPGTPEDGNQVTVTIQRGETLGEIARKFGITVSDLMSANNITDPRKVQAGQKLVVPGFQPVGTGAVPPVQTPPRSPSPAPANPPATAPSEAEPALELPPPVLEQSADSEAPPVEEAAPPVQPIDEPTPAP